MLKMYIILLISLGGAYGFGYMMGQDNERQKNYGDNVKMVDKRSRRW